MNNFENALELHLKSIKDRDIAVFSDFLDPSQNSIIILPSGDMISGYENIIDFHKQWFEDLDWHMDIEIIDTFAIESVGYALLDIVYHDLDEEGNHYELKYFLSLIFNQIDGKWILIRDQNTLK